MIEILNAFFLIACLAIIFSFPFSNLSLANRCRIKLKDIFEVYVVNFTCVCSAMLVLAFFELNLTNVFYIFLCLALINLLLVNRMLFKNTLSHLIVFFFFVFIYFVKIADHPALEWDAFSHWIYKVKNFYYGYSYKNFYNLPNHNAYPPLGSYLWAFFWKGSLVNNEYTGRIIFVFAYFLSLYNNI